MAIEITIPRLDWSMEEGTFVEWLKKDGDTIQKGDMLFVLESGKAAQEIECLDEGVLRIEPNGPQPGDVLKVGAVIARLVSDQAEVQPSRMRKASTPRARRVSRELGVDWTTLSGSGKNGRIRELDVRGASPVRPQAAADVSGRDLTPTRKLIAERMTASLRESAPVTLTTRCDVTNLIQLRSQFQELNQSEAPVPSLTDLLIKLTSKALQAHPALNGYWDQGQIRIRQNIDIAMAVDVESGLTAPVLRDVANLGIKSIAVRSRELIAKARELRLTSEDLRGGTFTVSNLGMYGIDAFTPIINPPQFAILGIGAIRREAVFLKDDRRPTPRHLVTFSLTFDHRVLDGAPAARFLKTLSELSANPAAALID